MSGQPRFGAKTSLPLTSTRPGSDTPMPSQTMRGCALRSFATDRATLRTQAAESRGVGHEACATKRASTFASPTIVISGRSTTPMIPARSTLRCRNRGRRPRGRRPIAPSVTHPSSIS